MTGRGLGASIAAQPRTLTKGSRLEARLSGLAAAVDAARGRIDDDLLDDVQASAARATGRLQLSAAHTVVAIAGSTGSGKSSIFNALAGATISASGAQRPTTSTAKALLWSDDDLGEMLEWLGVRPDDQYRRSGLDSAPAKSRLPEGLVLLDLPDHDSIEVAHHREAHRMVELADLLIWVVDPQKYADAAIHRQFLRPLAGHRAVTLVVLNHIDTVPEERRTGMLRDLRKLLVADGIRDPRVLATSAREGIGMDDLRTAIRRRVEEKQNSALRVEADIRAAASRVEEASGDAPTSVPDVWIADLERRIGEAAGVTALAEETRRAARAEAARRTSLLGGGTRTPVGDGQRSLGAIDRRAADTAVRSLVDNVCRDLAPAWADPVRTAATARLGETDDRLDAELAALRFELRPPGWLPLLGPARAVAALGTVATAGWLGVAATSGAALAVPVVAGALVVLLGIAVLVMGRSAVDRYAAAEAGLVEDECRRVIDRVVRGQVLAPMRTELASYARFRRDLSAAKA
ncbi:GTPase [Nocardioides sp. MH1]|uniref:GTPase n=1 Tax=Nocardioides sp. MH1 TaxID=3242490 RepID=UPI003521A2B3